MDHSYINAVWNFERRSRLVLRRRKKIFLSWDLTPHCVTASEEGILTEGTVVRLIELPTHLQGIRACYKQRKVHKKEDTREFRVWHHGMWERGKKRKL